jgi:transcriptional regulator NrdR family protein
LLNLVVKSSGEDQKYDEKKLYASIYASLIVCKSNHKEAELIAAEVTKLMRRWVGTKSHVSSKDLRAEATKKLREYNHVAAYVYAHHRMLS